MLTVGPDHAGESGAAEFLVNGPIEGAAGISWCELRKTRQAQERKASVKCRITSPADASQEYSHQEAVNVLDIDPHVLGNIGGTELNRKRSTVTLHAVASLDGFIARHDNSVSWLDTPGDVYERGVSDERADEVISAIDCYVLGSRTYETRASARLAIW